MSTLKYLSAYSPDLQAQVQGLIDDNRLDRFLLDKYPTIHSVANDKALRDFVLGLKQTYLKKSDALSKIV
ncbi:MAG: hypothetical protein ACI9RY_001647, partial [Reinekea sp.]